MKKEELQKLQEQDLVKDEKRHAILAWLDNVTEAYKNFKEFKDFPQNEKYSREYHFYGCDYLAINDLLPLCKEAGLCYELTVFECEGSEYTREISVLYNGVNLYTLLTEEEL